MTEADKGFPKICKLSVIGKVQQKGFLQHNYLCQFHLLLGSTDGSTPPPPLSQALHIPSPPAHREGGKKLSLELGGLLQCLSFLLNTCTRCCVWRSFWVGYNLPIHFSRCRNKLKMWSFPEKQLRHGGGLRAHLPHSSYWREEVLEFASEVR